MLRLLKFSVVAFIGCGFVGMIIYALWMRDEIRNAQMEPPLVAAPDIPVKRRPEVPGGMEIPNQDKLVFDLLDNSNSATAPLPAPADSADAIGDVIENAASDEALSADRTADQLAIARMAAASVEEVSAVKPVPDENVTPKEMAVAQVVPVVPAKEKSKLEDIKPVAKVDTKADTKVAVKPVEKSVADDVKTVAKKGVWGVQLAAVASQNDALKMANELKSKFKPLAGLTPRTSKVVTSGASRYRVQFYGLESRAAAIKVCDQLGAKQPCFPVGN